VNNDPAVTRAVLEVREAKRGEAWEYITLQNKAHLTSELGAGQGSHREPYLWGKLWLAGYSVFRGRFWSCDTKGESVCFAAG